jgi:hypothetical protein
MPKLYRIELGANGWLRLYINNRIRTQHLPAYINRKAMLKPFKGWTQ